MCAEVVTRKGAPDKAGYLKKQGGRFTAYKKRYFELRNGALYYFRKKEDPKPAGCIPLQGCECSLEDGKHKNVFIITGPFARVYHVMGDSPEDVKSWIDAIAKTVSSLSSGKKAEKGEEEGETQIFGGGSGKVSSKDFELVRVIGRGSFGKVMQVRKKDTGEIFAMKVLKKEVIIRENMIGHTKQEKSILQRIQHPFIVNLKFAFQTPEKLYLVMEYLGGGELFFHLKKDGRFKEDRARFYTAEITMAIEHLHNNSIIYRDLKPENIVLGHDGHLGLTDFGLAKTFISSGAPTYTFCGTPEYLAPEILMGVGHNKAVDWWSLGVLLYEMITGIPPFYSENVNEMYELILKAPLHFPEYVSPNARSILKGLLERDPKKRLGSGPTDGAEIRAHPFFATINWSDLFDKKVRAPFVPSKTDADKGEYFDEEFTTERAVDSFAEVTKDSETSFQGFTYTGESALSKADK